MNIKLPIKSNPYIVSRSSTGFQLSVIQAVYGKNVDHWLSEQFINLIYEHDSPIHCDFLREDFWFTKCKLFERQSMTFSRDIFEFQTIDIFNFICQALKNGAYIMGDYNPFFIPCHCEFQKVHRKKDYLIYGVNTESKKIYTLGLNRFGQYGKLEISIEDYLKSISHREDKMFNINCYTPNPNFNFLFDTKTLQKKLEDYLYSTSGLIGPQESNIICGINAIKKFREECQGMVGENLFFDYRSFLAIEEHKHLMNTKWKYMNVIDARAHDYSISKLVYKSLSLARKTRQSAYEYNNMRNYESAGRAIENLKQLVQLDCDLFAKLINFMEENKE